MSETKDAAALARRMTHDVLTARGESDPELRAAVAKLARGESVKAPVEPVVAALAAKVRDEPVSADLQAVSEAGYSDDAIFELVLAAAVSAGGLRLERGLAALEEGDR